MYTCDMNRKNIEKEKIDFHFVDKRKMIWKWIRCRFQWSKSKANIKFENAFAVQKRFKTLSTYYLFFFIFFSQCHNHMVYGGFFSTYFDSIMIFFFNSISCCFRCTWMNFQKYQTIFSDLWIFLRYWTKL